MALNDAVAGQVGQERIGEARKWKEEPLQKLWVHGKLPKLEAWLGIQGSC